MTPHEAADLVSMLAVCTQMYQPLLAGLSEAIRDYPQSRLHAVEVPGVIDAHGGGPDVVRTDTRTQLLAAARALADLPPLLDIAHRNLRRLQLRTDDGNPS